MCNKRIVLARLVLIATSLFAAGCASGVRVGDLQTRSTTVELGDADSVNVEIQMGAGKLDMAGGANQLLEASFTYNVKELDPQATYANGRLVIKDSDVDEGIASLFDVGEYRNEWDLRLNENVPMELNIDLGAGHSNLVLGSLALTSLNINGGAGDVNLDLNGSQSLRRINFDMGAGGVAIDLTGDWQHDLEARFAGGLGEFSLSLPSNVGVIIEVETGIGGVRTSGLARDGDTYTNDAYGVSDTTLRIYIEGGVGQINLDVE